MNQLNKNKMARLLQYPKSMKTFDIKSILKRSATITLSILLTAAYPSFVLAQTEHSGLTGNGGTGGGNGKSKKLFEVIQSFTPTSKKYSKYREDLLSLVTNISKLESQGISHETVIDLVKRGILKDIAQADYKLEKKCIDETGEEKSASTKKEDLSYQENPVRPPVCINVTKITNENLSREDIIGLLFHEHARHFGLEDTDNLGFHPLAYYITTKYATLPKSLYINQTLKSLSQKTLYSPATAISPESLYGRRTLKSLIEKPLYSPGTADALREQKNPIVVVQALTAFDNNINVIISLTTEACENYSIRSQHFDGHAILSSDVKVKLSHMYDLAGFDFTVLAKKLSAGSNSASQCLLRFYLQDGDALSEVFEYNLSSQELGLHNQIIVGIDFSRIRLGDE